MNFETQHEYRAVQQLIKELDDEGVLERFQGACLPASEIVQAVLHARGIKARLLECTALVANSPANGNSIHFIGFDTVEKLLQPHETDTHFIVLVEAATPFIVDASIGSKMGSAHFVVVSALSRKDPDILSEARFNAATVTYRVKKNIRYPVIHQRTLLERLEDERKVRSDIGLLFTAVKTLVGIGIFNMLANTVLVILKVLNP